MSASGSAVESPAGSTVAVSTHDGVWLFSIRRPPVNAIDLSLVQTLSARLAEAEAAPDCLALVLTGSGQTFSAGIDVKIVPAYDAATRAEMLRSINRLVMRLYGLPKPTVAAINGHALGGGLVMALACDFRFASAGNYRLGLTEVRAGIPFPAAPMIVVRAELAPGAARWLTLGGAEYPPEEPPMATLIDRFTAPGTVVDMALAHAGDAAKAPAYATVKRQLKGPALDAMARLVASDDDPLLRSWL